MRFARRPRLQGPKKTSGAQCPPQTHPHPGVDINSHFAIRRWTTVNCGVGAGGGATSRNPSTYSIQTGIHAVAQLLTRRAKRNKRNDLASVASSGQLQSRCLIIFCLDEYRQLEELSPQFSCSQPPCVSRERVRMLFTYTHGCVGTYPYVQSS